MGETVPTNVRTRPDQCPGILRPWPAEDGPLVRIRLVGGHLTADQFRALTGLSAEYGDGDLHLTSRANVQVRAVSDPAAFADDLERIGLLPSRTHERARNIVVSPGGELLPLARRLDELLCATSDLAELPGRFLIAFDDRGDLGGLSPDLGVRAADDARLIVGGRLGEPISLAEVPNRLVELAVRFIALRGEGPAAAWHVHELTEELAPADGAYVGEPDLAAQVDVPDGRLTPELAAALDVRDHLLVTPWKGVIPR